MGESKEICWVYVFLTKIAAFFGTQSESISMRNLMLNLSAGGLFMGI